MPEVAAGSSSSALLLQRRPAWNTRLWSCHRQIAELSVGGCQSRHGLPNHSVACRPTSARVSRAISPNLFLAPGSVASSTFSTYWRANSFETSIFSGIQLSRSFQNSDGGIGFTALLQLLSDGDQILHALRRKRQSERKRPKWIVHRGIRRSASNRRRRLGQLGATISVHLLAEVQREKRGTRAVMARRIGASGVASSKITVPA